MKLYYIVLYKVAPVRPAGGLGGSSLPKNCKMSILGVVNYTVLYYIVLYYNIPRSAPLARSHERGGRGTAAPWKTRKFQFWRL